MKFENLWNRQGKVEDKELAEKMAYASDTARTAEAHGKQYIEVAQKLLELPPNLAENAENFIRKILGKKRIKEETQERMQETKDRIETYGKEADVLEELVATKETVKKEVSNMDTEKLRSLAKELYFVLPDWVKGDISFLENNKQSPLDLQLLEQGILFGGQSKETILLRAAFYEMYKILKMRDNVGKRQTEERGFS